MDLLIERSLRRNKSKIGFASLFGSYKKGKFTNFSDLDILVVCEKEGDKPKIERDLTLAGFKSGWEVHANIFSSEIYDERIKRHDYILASILNDSMFLFGDQERFLKSKALLQRRPGRESIEFNRRIGEKIFGEAEPLFAKLLKEKHTSSPFEYYEHKREILLSCLRNFHVSLGYLLASYDMKRASKAVNLTDLLSSPKAMPVKNLIAIEKDLRHHPYKPIDLKAIQTYIEKAKESLDF